MLLRLAPLLLFIACTQDSGTSTTPSTNSSSTTISSSSVTKVEPDFAANSVFQTNCLGCHGTPTANGAPFSLSTKAQITAKKSGILSTIENGSMPPRGALSNADHKTVVDWINTLN